MAIIFMLVAGCGIAAFVMTAAAIAKREQGGDPAHPAAPELTGLAASLLYQVLILGGVHSDEAYRELRRRAGVAAPVTSGIDVSNWAERFRQLASAQQRSWLLETAVQLVAARPNPVPLRQYNALLDLSFGLGFHTDALAKLREQYGFEYVDHAKASRPREADRAGGAAPLFVRQQTDVRELLVVLGIEGTPSRHDIISAYRKLAAQHHPDRFHDRTDEAKTAAAAKFIEITRAYETLLSRYRD